MQSIWNIQKNFEKRLRKKNIVGGATLPNFRTYNKTSVIETVINNKASGGDGIPVKLFQILKDGAVKVLNSFGKLSSGHRIGKGQFSFYSQRKAMPKNVQTTAQLHSSHTLAK